jgi:hypothetical protein
MKTLDINMMFWTDGLSNSTRERNVKYSFKKLKELCSYINSTQKIKCNYNLYDYSPTQLIEESIHIPYPLAVYKRSEKINNILHNTTADLFSVIDSDCFIEFSDYDKLISKIEENGINSCITFDVIDFDSDQTTKIINNESSPEVFIAGSRFPGRAGMLGAFFITNTLNIKKHGGFNTKFTTWGGEDGEIYDKIWSDNDIKKVQIKRDDIKLFHLSHISDRENINYFNHEEYVRNNF